MALKAIESSTAVIGNVHLVYDKSEADREIRRHKRKRCLAMSRQLNSEMYEAWRQDDAVWGLHAKKWSDKWRELADKFKE